MDSTVTDVTHDQTASAAVGVAGTSRVMLPIEVEERIIRCLDSLHDRDTLTKCALVCKFWLPCSRHKLYNKITILDEDQWEQFGELLHRPPEGIVHYLKATKEISVGRDELGRRWGVTSRKELSKLLTSYARRFPGLQSLELTDLIWGRSSFTGKTVAGSNPYQRLTSLSLQYCTARGLQSLARPACHDRFRTPCIGFSEHRAIASRLWRRSKVSNSRHRPFSTANWIKRSRTMSTR